MRNPYVAPFAKVLGGRAGARLLLEYERLEREREALESQIARLKEQRK